MKNLLLATLFFLMPLLLFSQRTITGIVYDKEKTPVYDALVMQKGTATSANTDTHGKFSLILEDKKAMVLVISHPVIARKEVEIGQENELEIIIEVLNPVTISVEEQVLIKEGSTRLEAIPVQYETVTEQVRENPSTDPSVKPTYKTVTKQVVVSPATTREVAVPSEYKTVTKKVLIAPKYQIGNRLPVGHLGFQTPPSPSAPRKKESSKVSAVPFDTYGVTLDVDSDDLLSAQTGIVESKKDSKKNMKIIKKEEQRWEDAALQSNAREKEKTMAGKLTAGEVNDFAKWELWNDVSQSSLLNWSTKWNMLPKSRYTVQLLTEDGTAIINAKVSLELASGKIAYEARTDNTGKAELWYALFNKEESEAKQITINYENDKYTIPNPSKIEEGVNFLELPLACKSTKQLVDIAFVVDATGSMCDEIEYLKAEMMDVIGTVKKQNPEADLRTGTVFYRDHDTKDSYLTKLSQLTNNLQSTMEAIRAQKCVGGSTVPEAVTEAMEVAVNDLEWRENATTRLLFLILDAPPHKGTEARLEIAIRQAAEKGIRIIPLVCSGADKSTEYLMRAMALATNGNYTFLTDDSGIGGGHMKPTTDSYDTNLLNALLVRLITQYTEIGNCEDSFGETLSEIKKENKQLKRQKEFQLKYYPNPTSGQFQVKTNKPIQEIFISDVNGKLLLRKEGNDKQEFQFNIGDFPAGIYFVRCHFGEEEWRIGRIVLVRN